MNQRKCANAIQPNMIFISRITFNRRITHKSLKELIEKVCLENSFHYIENTDVNENDLFMDGLHLENSGKKFCFIISL